MYHPNFYVETNARKTKTKMGFMDLHQTGGGRLVNEIQSIYFTIRRELKMERRVNGLKLIAE